MPLFAIVAVVVTVTLLLVRGFVPKTPIVPLRAAVIAAAVALALRAYAKPVLSLVDARGPYPNATRLIRNPAVLADDSTRLYLEAAWNVLANLPHLWLNGIVWLGLCLLAGIAITAAKSRCVPGDGYPNFAADNPRRSLLTSR